MDVSLCRRHIHEYITRGHPILVAEEKGKVIGECELWLAEEPQPFGRYAAIEMLMTIKDADESAVEMALMEKGAEKCKKLGVFNYDVSQEHCGDRPDWAKLGFEELRDTRTCLCDIRTIEEPDFDFTAKPEVEKYERINRLLAWNHYEPAEYTLEFHSGLWPTAKLIGFDRHTSRLFMSIEVEAFGFEFLMHASRPDWTSEERTIVDIWSNTSVIRKNDMAQLIIKCVAATVDRLGDGILEVNIPKQLLPAAREMGFRGGEKPGLWLRKKLD